MRRGAGGGGGRWAGGDLVGEDVGRWGGAGGEVGGGHASRAAGQLGK